jgi:hypothetical protein
MLYSCLFILKIKAQTCVNYTKCSYIHSIFHIKEQETLSTLNIFHQNKMGLRKKGNEYIILFQLDSVTGHKLHLNEHDMEKQ